MQLGGAASDLPHALEHRRHLGRVGGNFVGYQALLIDQAVERRAGNAPGIALIFDESVHRNESGAGFAFDELNRAEQSGRVAEMRNIDQEAANLEFGMKARR